MAPKTRAKSATMGAHDSQNTKRCGHCGASMRSKDTETALQDTANAAVKVCAAALDSVEPVDEPRESAEVPSRAVPSEWNGRRRRSWLPTRDEQEAAATLVQMKQDPNYSAPG